MLEPARALSLIQSILWPEDDPEESWSPDTLDDIASVMVESGYGPPDPEGPSGTDDDIF